MLIKNIIIFLALFFLSYLLSVLVVLLLTFCFFRDANPHLEIVLLVFGVIVPVVSIVGAIIGTMFFIKRSHRKAALRIEDQTG